ncbi:unnamed protein product [Cladocopium goreaui]|uniref:Uncharacterized protein n=1 Tax=Cladocopium goreaui TaxID=2562237 RepID=A0A9P1DLD1_9DINO|nr:unnamed protein product [Cladocopium goreaui]
MASSGSAYPEAVGCSCWLQLLQSSRQFTRRICGRQAEAAVPIDPEVPMFGVSRYHQELWHGSMASSGSAYPEAAGCSCWLQLLQSSRQFTRRIILVWCEHIHQAAEEGNVGAVRHFLRVDPESLERKDYMGRTALHWAAEEGHAAVVEQLISAGATVDAAGWNGRGRTALHWAAEEGHAAVVEQLISAGATVDAAGWNGRGPGRVFGSFWEWLWRGDGRVVHWQGIFVLCFGMLSGIRSCCVRIHFCEWMGLLQFGYKRLDMGEMSGRHVVTNVHWIWNF